MHENLVNVSKSFLQRKNCEDMCEVDMYTAKGEKYTPDNEEEKWDQQEQK